MMIRLLLGWFILIYGIGILPSSLAYWNTTKSTNDFEHMTLPLGEWDEYENATPFQEGKWYFRGNKVLYNGRLWIVIASFYVNSIPGTSPGDYNEITNQWRSYNTYKKGVTVYHEGVLWIAKRNSVNQEPPLYPNSWRLINEGT